MCLTLWWSIAFADGLTPLGAQPQPQPHPHPQRARKTAHIVITKLRSHIYVMMSSNGNIFSFFFGLCLNSQLSKQSRRWWFEMPLRSLWRHLLCIQNRTSTKTFNTLKPSDDAVLWHKSGLNLVKMAAIFQTPFSNVISWFKMYEFRVKFHWSLFLSVKLTIFQHCFR